MHSRIAFALWVVLVSTALTGGCTIVVAPTASPLPSPSAINPATLTMTRPVVTITPTHASPMPTISPAATPSSNHAGAPAWWPRDLSMPVGVEYQGESDSDKAIPDRLAHWLTQEQDLDALRDRLVKQGKDAGYTVTVLEKTNGLHAYTISLLKDTQAFQLHLLGLPSLTTHVDVAALPTFQFKTTGATAQAIILAMSDWGVQSNLSMNLATPMRSGPTPDLRTAVSATVAAVSPSLHLTALQPNDQCANCRYAISLTIPSYKGPGTYNAADMQVNPGGDKTIGDYHNPTNCTIIVKDEFNGTFECQGLKNAADQTKTIDLRGTWQAPVR